MTTDRTTHDTAHTLALKIARGAIIDAEHTSDLAPEEQARAVADRIGEVIRPLADALDRLARLSSMTLDSRDTPQEAARRAFREAAFIARTAITKAKGA